MTGKPKRTIDPQALNGRAPKKGSVEARERMERRTLAFQLATSKKGGPANRPSYPMPQKKEKG